MALTKRLKCGRKKNWQDAINAIEKAVDAKVREKAGAMLAPASAKRRADGITFYTAAAKEFRYFKEAWRNRAVHGRARYSENDAAKIMNHVRDFMGHLATRLKETK